jgi:hypothetical protein
MAYAAAGIPSTLAATPAPVFMPSKITRSGRMRSHCSIMVGVTFSAVTSANIVKLNWLPVSLGWRRLVCAHAPTPRQRS